MPRQLFLQLRGGSAKAEVGDQGREASFGVLVWAARIPDTRYVECSWGALVISPDCSRGSGDVIVVQIPRGALGRFAPSCLLGMRGEKESARQKPCPPVKGCHFGKARLVRARD